MSYLEDDLKMALRRTEPPEGFAERVLARANGPAPPEPSWWEYLTVLVRPPRVQWVALERDRQHHDSGGRSSVSARNGDNGPKAKGPRNNSYSRCALPETSCITCSRKFWKWVEWTPDYENPTESYIVSCWSALPVTGRRSI